MELDITNEIVWDEVNLARSLGIYNILVKYYYYYFTFFKEI